MKKILAATLFAAMALSAGMDGAFAQAAGNNGGNGGNGGRGGSSAGPSSAGGGALNAVRIVRASPNCLAGANCNPPRRRYRPRVVEVNDGCECTTQSIGVGRNISYVKNCYYYDPVADAQRYCAPWERAGN